MISTELITSILMGALPISPVILYVGAAFLGLAVVGGIVGGIVVKARAKRHPQPNEFEAMVEREMQAQGVTLEEQPTIGLTDELVDEPIEEAPQSAEPNEEPDDEEPVAEDELEEDREAPAEDDGSVPVPEEIRDAEVEIAQGGGVEAEPAPQEEEEPALVRSTDEPIAYADEATEEDIPDLIPNQSSAAMAAMAATDDDASEEEEEMLMAAEDVAETHDTDATLLSSMTDSKDYGDFDFGGDFDEWEDDPEEEEESAEEDSEMLADIDGDADDADDNSDEKVDEAILGSKYRRSFRSKLIQGSRENKQYYSLIKNRLLSFDKMRVKENWGGETYMHGRRTYVRLGIGRKTLCVFFALDPNAFDVKKVHHRDVSGVRKYASTPMMVRVKSDRSCRRALRLIEIVTEDNHIPKKAVYAMADYTQELAYKDDDALIALNLIKLNPRFVQQIDTAQALEAQAEEAKRSQYREVTPIKKDQVTNLLDTGEPPRKEREPRVAVGEGKFVVDAESGLFRFKYYTPNAKLLVVSDSFKTYEVAIKAVDAFRAAIESGEVVISTIDGKYFYTLRSRGRVFNSVMYDTQAACLEGLRLAREYATDAIIEYNPN